MKLNTKIKSFSKSAIEVRSKFPLFALFYFTLILFSITFFQIVSPDLNFLFVSVLLSSLVPGLFISISKPGIFISVSDYKKFSFLPPMNNKESLSFGLMLGGSFIVLQSKVTSLRCRGGNYYLNDSLIMSAAVFNSLAAALFKSNVNYQF